MRRAETKVVDADHKKSHYEEVVKDYDSLSHLERLVCGYKAPNIYPRKVSANGEPADMQPTSTNNQMKTNGKEIHGADLVLQNSGYKVVNNHVYGVPNNPAHVDMTSTSTDGGSKKALAGLIFMSNDKVRRSSFKYGVLGMPMAKKPILDRVEPCTKLFFFEFEARVLWGIYEATSDVSLDIEKDAYRGSEVPFPAQVKVRVYKQFRPLPERIFQLAIEDNYFTPTKFNFELTEQQVSKLTKLYSLQEIDNVRVDGKSISSVQNNIPYEIDGARVDDRVIPAAAQSGYPCEIDTARVDGRGISAAQNSIPYSARLQDTDKHPNCREGLKNGDMAGGSLIGSRYIGKDKLDTLKSASINCKDSPIPNREEHLQDIIQGDLNGGLSLGNSRPTSRYYTYARTKPFLPEAKATNANFYIAKDEILSEDDPRHQICEAELPQHAGDFTHEPRRRGTMIDYRKDSPDLFDTVSELKRSLEGPLEEEYRLYKLKMKHLNDRVLVRQQPHSSDEHDRSESPDYTALPGNTQSNVVNASQVTKAKYFSNDLQPALRKKVLINKDDCLKAEKRTSSYKDCGYARGFVFTQGLRRSLGNGFPSYTEAVLDMPGATKEVLESCSTTHKLVPTVVDYPVEVSDDGPDYEDCARNTHDFLPLLENGYSKPSLLKTSIHLRTLNVPVEEAWPGNHGHVAESFATRGKASTHSRTLTVPDDEAWLGNHSHAAHTTKTIAERSNTVENDNKAWVENASRVAKSFTSRSKTVRNDDKAQVGNLQRVANRFAPRSYNVEDDETWLEKARSVVVNSFISRSNNNVEDAYKKREQSPPLQVENQVQRSLLRILGKRPRFAAALDLPAGNDDLKPRRSVWSRLSAPRNTLNSRQISKELVLPNEGLGESLLSRGSLPWKRRVVSTRSYQKH